MYKNLKIFLAGASASLALFGAAKAQTTGGEAYVNGSTVGGGVSAVGITYSNLNGSAFGVGASAVTNNPTFNSTILIRPGANVDSLGNVVVQNSNVNGNMVAAAGTLVAGTGAAFGYGANVSGTGIIDQTNLSIGSPSSLIGALGTAYTNNVVSAKGDVAAFGVAGILASGSAIGAGVSATGNNDFYSGKFVISNAQVTTAAGNATVQATALGGNVDAYYAAGTNFSASASGYGAAVRNDQVGDVYQNSYQFIPN